MVYPQFSKKIIHPKSIAVCNVLKNAGYKAYLVGGCVRDLILNIEPKDWDITTDALPQKVIELFEKTYPTGLQHGTITVSIENELFEVTTFRVEGKYIDGRRPEEVFFVSDIYQDLSRRDLTINAMAYDPISDELIDPFYGLDDLKNKIIRTVGNANDRFQEDGLRIMRAARFAARFGYSIDPDTFTAMQNNLSTLNKVSKERIKDELCKLLNSKFDNYGLQLLLDSKVIDIVCPSLKNTLMSYQNKCLGDVETKLAYLYCCTEITKAKSELIGLKFSNKEIKKIVFLLDLLERYNNFIFEDTVFSYKQFMAHLKNNTPDTWEYTLDQFIKLCSAMGFVIIDKLVKYQHEIVFSRNEMKINGDDLIALGIPRGPEIKKILDNCYKEILNNPDNNDISILLRMVMNPN